LRAFLIAARAAVTYYNDLFLLIGLSILWWLTGGVFFGVAVVLAIPMFVAEPGSAWWLTPLVAIPAGPAISAMAVVVRRSARDIRVDRGFYMEGLREHWRPAIILSAIGAVVLALLLLNFLFYSGQSNRYLQVASLVWGYLIVMWLAVQFYAYPILVAMERPRPLVALRTSAIATFANPLFSALLVLVAAILTTLSTVLAAPLLIAWPALMALLGQHALRLILERAGVNLDQNET
jgi:uncharacterized membrane protein YesL